MIIVGRKVYRWRNPQGSFAKYILECSYICGLGIQAILVSCYANLHFLHMNQNTSVEASKSYQFFAGLTNQFTRQTLYTC